MKVIQYKYFPSTSTPEYPRIWSITYRRWWGWYNRTIICPGEYPSEDSSWYYQDTGTLVTSRRLKDMIRSLRLIHWTNTKEDRSEVCNP